MENIEKLEALVALAKEEGTKFYVKGNAAAGTRLRKVMQDLKSTATAIRGEVVSIKNSQK